MLDQAVGHGRGVAGDARRARRVLRRAKDHSAIQWGPDDRAPFDCSELMSQGLRRTRAGKPFLKPSAELISTTALNRITPVLKGKKDDVVGQCCSESLSNRGPTYLWS
eukprot:8569863-Pyramimonas_sp.AAC.1